MNRRAFLRGAITVGVVAAIAKGRLVDDKYHMKLYRGEKGHIQGITIRTPAGGHHEFYQRLINEEVHSIDGKRVAFDAAVWGEAA